MYRAPGHRAAERARQQLAAGILAMTGLMIFKPSRLSEAAAIIGEADTPEERGLLDA